MLSTHKISLKNIFVYHYLRVQRWWNTKLLLLALIPILVARIVFRMIKGYDHYFPIHDYKQKQLLKNHVHNLTTFIFKELMYTQIGDVRTLVTFSKRSSLAFSNFSSSSCENVNKAKSVTWIKKTFLKNLIIEMKQKQH